MRNTTRQDSIRINSSECPSCNQKGLAHFVIEEENTRTCGTCFQELGPRNDVPMPLFCINRMLKRLGRGSGFALVEFDPNMEVRRSHVCGMDDYSVVRSLAMMMTHRTRPDIKVKLQWFTHKRDEKKALKATSRREPDYLTMKEKDEADRQQRRAALDDRKLRAHADDTICGIVEAILKGMRGENIDAVKVTQTCFQPAPWRSFVRFEIDFWFDMDEDTLQVMRGELSWDTVSANS